MHAKTLNYAKLAIIEQEKEAHSKFLDRLREALRKLLKRAYGPNQSLGNLLQLAQTVYYGREYEEKKERQKRTKKQAEALKAAMALKTGS